MKIAVILACHNRREQTLACFEALFASEIPAAVALEVFLVDDGSTDGTRDAIRSRYPDTHIMVGDGSLYWNGGMRLAFGAALERGFEQYLWLNDDTYLYPATIATLLQVAASTKKQTGKGTVIVGTTQSRPGTPPNHGGIARWRRLNSTLVVPGEAPLPCETMYGNCVLISHEVAERIGNLDAAFVHSMGDIDYGLRATAEGFPVLVMPGYAGTCDLNPIAGSLGDRSLSLLERYKKLLGPKGLPLKPWFVFLWRHLGLAGPPYWAWTYAKVTLSWCSSRLKGA